MARPRESIANRAARTLRIVDALRAAYPDAHCELHYSNPLELLVATILSAQCSDRQVNRVTASLFPRYPTAAHFAGAPLADLEHAIRSIGLFRNKAKNIQAACQSLLDHHQGEVPNTLEALVALAGVGRKTANVVLGNAFHITSGIVVDTHVARLATRLGLTRERDPGKTERDLCSLVPRECWTLFSHWLIWHGRRRCSARSPNCADCEIRAECPSAHDPHPSPSRPPRP